MVFITVTWISIARPRGVYPSVVYACVTEWMDKCANVSRGKITSLQTSKTINEHYHYTLL